MSVLYLLLVELFTVCISPLISIPTCPSDLGTESLKLSSQYTATDNTANIWNRKHTALGFGISARVNGDWLGSMSFLRSSCWTVGRRRMSQELCECGHLRIYAIDTQRMGQFCGTRIDLQSCPCHFVVRQFSIQAQVEPEQMLDANCE